MRNEGDLNFPYYTRPHVYLFGAAAFALAACFCLYQRSAGPIRPSQWTINTMNWCAGGLALAGLLSFLQGLRVSFSANIPSIVFNKDSVAIPQSWLGWVDTIEFKDLVSASIEYGKDTPAIEIQRTAGKPIKLSASYFMTQKEFEACWSVLDGICQGQNSSLDQINIQQRALCQLCGNPFVPAQNADQRCSTCASLSVSDIRALGLHARLLGAALTIVGGLSLWFTLLAGFGVIFYGFIAVGISLFAAGVHVHLTGTISRFALGIFRYTYFWRN